jgi:hypothetical protein
MIKKYLPLVISFFLLLTAAFFWRSWIKDEIPLPGDHAVGVYHPWIDYKWAGFPAGVPVKNPSLADIPSLFYPQKLFSMAQFRLGGFPSWNPLIFNGYPLLANIQSGVLNPFNIYFLLFPSEIAWTFFIMTQPLLSLIFTYFFLRLLRISPSAAVFGAVIYAFCGFNLLWLEYGIHGYVSAAIPLLFALIYLAVNRHPRYWLYFGAVFSWQLFCGYPQISLYTLIFGGLWLIYLLPQRQFLPVNLLKYFGGFILGLGLSALLLIPAAELFLQSQRINEPLAGGQNGAYYQWHQVVTLLAPDFFGNPSTYNTWSNTAYTNNTGYASIIGFTLALLGLFSQSKYRKFFIWLYLIPIFLSLPSPLSAFIQKLPLFSASVATRIMVFSGLAVSVLAAMGWQRLCSGSRLKLTPVVIPGLLLGLVGTIAVIGWRFSLPGNWLVGIRNLFFPAFFYVVSALLILFAYYKPKLRPLLLGLLVLSVAAELFRFGWKYNSFFPRRLIFPSTPEIEFLQRQSNYRIDGGDVLPLSLWMSYGLYSSTGYDAVFPSDWAKFLGAIETGDLLHPKGRIADILTYNSQLFDLTGTGYVLAQTRYKNQPYPQYQQPKLKPVYETKTFRIYKNENALPKYSLKTGFEFFSDPNLEINRLKNPDFNYHEMITLSDADIKTYPAASAYHLNIISDNPTRQTFLVTSDQPVYLLNTNSYYPGWIVKIDDRPAKLLKANFDFQSVQVPSGTHLVEFTYHPLSLTIGAVVSLISMLFLSFLYVRSPHHFRRAIASKRSA